jgi:hypothetical protein
MLRAAAIALIFLFSSNTSNAAGMKDQERLGTLEAVVAGGPATQITALPGAEPNPESSGSLGGSKGEKTLSNGLVLVGPWAVAWENGVAGLAVNRIENNASSRTTGTLRLEIWAVAQAPARGAGFTGFRLAVFSTFSPLSPNTFYQDIIRSGPFLNPPDGTYWFVLVLSEFNSQSCSAADSFCITDSINSDSQATFGTSLPPITPTTGTWWNPSESGTGYAIDVQHGVLTMLIFSYQSNGSPEWYYVSGSLANGGRNFTGTLDKYRNGQCISCFYPGRPFLPGNDGLVSITFFSSTTGVMTLPGGRVTSIQRTLF